MRTTAWNDLGDSPLALSNALLEASDDLIWAVDCNYCLIYGNKTFQDHIKNLTGKLPEVGKPAFYFEPGDNSNQNWHKHYESIFLKAENFSTETEILVSGEKKYFEFRFGTVKNIQTEIVAALIVGRNISAEKRNQSELLKNKAIVDQAGEMLFLHDFEGNILDINEAAIRQTEYSAKELLSMKIADLDIDVVERKDQQQIWDSLELTQKKVFQVKHRRKDGSIYPAEVTLSKIRIADEFKLLALVKDITLQKQAEAIQTARLGLLELASHCTLSELLRATLDEAEALSNSEISFYHFIEPNQNTVSLQEWSTKTIDRYCTATPPEFHYPVDRAGVWVECIAEMCPVVHNDYAALLNKKGLPEGHAHINRELLVPVIRKGNVVAILGVGNKSTDYDDNDVEIVSQLADLSWEIADNKRKDEALQKSLLSNTALIEAIPDLIFRLDKNAKYLSYKASPYELYYREADIVGKYNRDLTPPEFADLVDEKIKLTLETRTLQEYEYQLPIPDKGLQLYETRMVPDGKNEVIAIVRNITERKKKEERLKESEENYRNIYHNAPLGLYRTSIEDGRVLESNEQMARMFGYSSREDFFTSFFALDTYVNPKSREQLLKEIKEKGLVKNFEVQLYRKDRSIFWVSLTAKIYPEKGWIDGIAEDITERKRAMELLKESETRYITFLNASNDIAFLKDDQFRYIISNQANADFLGKPIEEVIGKDDFMLMNPEVAEGFRKSDEAVLKEKLPVKTIETVNNRIYEVTKFCVPLTDGRTGLGGYARDITDQKKALDDLRQREEEFRGIVVNAPIGIYRTTIEGRILMANDYLLEMLGYDSFEELAARNLEEEDYEPDYPRKKFLETIEKDGKITGLESAWKTRNGKTIIVSESARTVTDKDGNVLYYEGMVVDITEPKSSELRLIESEANLRELNATKDKFFSIIAHDLKNPFNGIIGFSELLLSEAKFIDVSEIENYARIINESANQALQLLNNLLQWARTQQGKIAFNPRKILLAEIANSIMAVTANAAFKKNIRVVNLIPPELIISADADMLKTVILNLLTNAIKFTRNDGIVEITMFADEDKIQVMVKDSGIGISKGNIQKLFRIDAGFYMLGTSNEKGTGLGLILCKEFIERHGGKIWVESEEEKGSTFIFTIPQRTDI